MNKRKGKENLREQGQRQEQEYLSPTLDVVFKMIFGNKNNKDMLINLIETYLEIDGIEDFVLTNVEVPPNKKRGKQIRLYLRVTTKEQEIDVEVQVYRDPRYINRCIYYWVSMYNLAVEQGDEYNAKPIYSLNILGFKEFDDDKPYISNFVWYDPVNKRQLTDKAKITFVELPKIRKCTPEQIKNDDKIAWSAFFNSKSKEDFAMLNQITNNKNVKKAVSIIGLLTSNDKAREIARKREEAIRIERSKIIGSREEGRAEGRAETIKAMREAGASDELIEAALRRLNTKSPGQHF